MTDVLTFLFSRFWSVISLMDSVRFPIFSLTVSLLDIFIGFLVMYVIIAVFWRGVRV